MRTPVALLAISAFSILNAGVLAAQSAGSIEGSVSTPGGEPATSVTMVVKGMNKRALTGKDGRYILKDIPEGRHTLVASRMGLAAKEMEVTVTAGGTARADFVLSETDYQLDGVTVNAARSANERPVAVGKVNIAPMDLPQSIAVVDRTVIEQQQALQLSDALKNVNGVYVMSTTGGTQEELAGRGFSLGSSSTFKNGVRFNNGVMPEVSSLERMEVLKGSSAILFGNVSAGGVVNLVTKKPQFYSGGEVSMRVGSYSLYKPAVDVYGPLLSSDVVAYRLNATYQNASSFRDSVGSERVYINPSLLFNIGGQTELLLEGDYLKDNRTSDYGTGAVNYAIADVPRNRFLGASWSYYQANQGSATATISHRFDEGWQIRGVAGYQSYRNDQFGTTRPNAGQFVATDGKWVRGVQRSEVNENYYIGQIDLTGEFATGFLHHTLLVGADADKYLTKTLAYENIAKYDSVNIYDMNAYAQRGDIPSLKQRTLTESPVNRAGVYVQDLVEIVDKVKLLAGVRWSYQETGSDVLTYATNATTTSKSYDDAVTPRFGLIYQPVNTMSVFASYSNSFTLNTGVDVAGNALPPSYINQYEFGVKNDLFERMVSANITVYQIVNSNLAQTSLANGNTNSNIKELAGEVTSRGVELDIATRPYQGLSFIGGYSYNQTKYTESNTYIVGSELRYNPSHTANASLYYTFAEGSTLQGLNLGASLLYIGDRLAGRSTRLTVANDTYKLMPIDAFTQFDISAGYRFEKIALRFKVSNVFDVLSYYAHDDNSINPIAPRMFSLTTNIQL